MENKVPKKRNIPMIGSMDKSSQEENTVFKSNKLYPEIEAYNGYVCTWKKNEDGSKEYKPVAKYVGVKEIVENIDADKMEVSLIYNIDKEQKEITVGLGEISTKNKIMNLADRGVDVNDNNANYLIKHLRDERENTPKKVVHSNIGFFEKDKQQFFKHYNVIANKKENDIPSTYIGNLEIKPKGSSKEWLSMVNKEVLGRPPLELALAIGFSAPIVGFISNSLGIDSPLIHLYGESSKGKTTAAMIAVSAFGSPNTKQDGLITTWYTTSNAMHGTLGGNTGIPIVFDETSMSNKKDFTKDIYSISSGKGKTVMDKEGNVINRKNWNTTSVSTGEHSIFAKSKENTGLRMRLFEFGNIDWTENAKHSERIKETILSNYGHYGILFVRTLISIGKEKVIQIHKGCKERLIEKMIESEFRERLAGNLAVITTAATVIKEYLKINLNLESIEKMIIENEDTSAGDKDLGEKAYEVIMQEVSRNRDKFGVHYDYWKQGNAPANDKETWGIIEYKGNRNNAQMQIVVIAKTLEKILNDSGFEDTKLVARNWKSKGWLDYEGEKTYRKRSINGIPRTKCYVIKVKNALEKNDDIKNVDSMDEMQ